MRSDIGSAATEAVSSRATPSWLTLISGRHLGMRGETRLSGRLRSDSHQIRSFLAASSGVRPPTGTTPTSVLGRIVGWKRAATIQKATASPAIRANKPMASLFILDIRMVGAIIRYPLIVY